MGVETVKTATPSTAVRFVGLRAESVDAISWATPEVVVSTVASTLMLAAETRSDMSEALT